MTTRDEIAARIAGDLAGEALEAEWIAKRSYDIADAMLHARGADVEEFPGLDVAVPKPFLNQEQ